MNNIIQNMKSGFANIKQTIEIILSDDSSNEGYDFYINSKNDDIAKTAQILRNFEEQQEPKRLSIFTPKKERKSVKKNFKTVASKNIPSPKTIDVYSLEENEPDK